MIAFILSLQKEIEAYLNKCRKDSFEAYSRHGIVLTREIAEKGIEYATQNEVLLSPSAWNCWAHLHLRRAGTHVGFIFTFIHSGHFYGASSSHMNTCSLSSSFAFLKTYF